MHHPHPFNSVGYEHPLYPLSRSLPTVPVTHMVLQFHMYLTGDLRSPNLVKPSAEFCFPPPRFAPTSMQIFVLPSCLFSG